MLSMALCTVYMRQITRVVTTQTEVEFEAEYEDEIQFY